MLGTIHQYGIDAYLPLLRIIAHSVSHISLIASLVQAKIHI